jgi:hypothetical protein
MTASILTALLLLAPVVTESGRFTIKQNGRTIGTEEFSVRPRDKGFTVEGRTRLEGDPTTLTSKMELDQNLVPISYEYSRGGKGAIRVVVDPKRTAELVIIENGKESATDFRFPPSASIVDNNFFHHYLMLLYRIKSADQTLAIFVPQDMQVGLAKVKSTGKGSYALEVGSVKLEATVDESGRLLKLAVPSAKVVVER